MTTDPFETLVETVPARRARGLDVPRPLSEPVEAELVRDLRRVHRVGQILLVREHQQQRIAQLVLVQHALQLLARLGHTLAIVRVDDENDALRVLEVCSRSFVRLVSMEVSTRSSEGYRRRGTHNASRGDESCPALQHPKR